jgi:hypothetical protein
VSHGVRRRLLEDAGDGEADDFAGHCGGGGGRGSQEARTSFSKKRSKKLLEIALASTPKGSLTGAVPIVKSFSPLFFKKEVLSFH